jgi:hypothetical protein
MSTRSDVCVNSLEESTPVPLLPKTQLRSSFEIDAATIHHEVVVAIATVLSIILVADHEANVCGLIIGAAADGELGRGRLAKHFGVGRIKCVAGRHFDIGRVCGQMAWIPPACSRPSLLVDRI